MSEHTNPGFKAPIIRVFDWIIPAIPASSRIVDSITLGALESADCALLGFFPSNMDDSRIEKLQYYGHEMQHMGHGQPWAVGPSTAKGYTLVGSNLSPLTADGFILAFPDYGQARRFAGPYQGENIGPVASHTKLPDGFTYDDIGAGALFGWYGLSGTGVLGIGAPVQLESAWITQEGENTILHIALVNNHTDASPSHTLKIGVFE